MHACEDRFDTKLKVRKTRWPPLAQLHHDAINSTDLALGAINELVVKNAADDVHNYTRVISRGMAMRASTKAESMVTPITALLKRPLRCSPA